MTRETAIRWCRENLQDLGGRRALVTGAASGLGFETAVGLASRGAQVILADRNVDGGQAAAEEIRRLMPAADPEFRPLDLADLDSVRRFAEAVEADGRPLDILINNAGILPPLQRRTTRDGFELKFGINVLGHFALTGRLLPALLRAQAPRVVTVSSLVHRHARIDFDDLQAERSYAPQRAYNQAKLACLIFALELQARSDRDGWPLASLAAHPGVARTALGDSRKNDKRRTLVDHLQDVAFWIAMNVFGQTQDRGALPILYAAAGAEAHGGDFYGPDGFGEMGGWPKRVKPSAPALDAAQRERLWSVCQRLSGVSIAS